MTGVTALLLACAGVAAVVRSASKTRPHASNTIMCGGPKKNLASLVTKSRLSFSHEIEAYILKTQINELGTIDSS